jgi:hypothetical protein
MMDLREEGWSVVDWIGLAQDRDKWKFLVNAIMKLWVAHWWIAALLVPDNGITDNRLLRTVPCHQHVLQHLCPVLAEQHGNSWKHHQGFPCHDL